MKQLLVLLLIFSIFAAGDVCAQSALPTSQLTEDDKAVDGIEFPNFYRIKPQIQSPLYLAIMGGHIAEALKAVEESANVNEHHDEWGGLTPLMLAASMGQVSVVKALIAKKADVNAIDKSGRPALMPACLKVRAAVVKVLIEAGANVNIKELSRGQTALMLANMGMAERKADADHQIDMVAELLDHGAEVNAQDNQGETALHTAALNAWIPGIEILIKHGAKPDIKNKAGFTAIDYVRSSHILPDAEKTRLSAIMGAPIIPNKKLADAAPLPQTILPPRAKNDPNAWFAVGRQEEILGHDDKAVDAYRNAIQLDPTHANALNSLGILEAKKDHTKEALAYWERAVAAQPPSAEAYYNLGRALIITKTDYKRGLLLLGAVAKTNGEAGKRARAFIDEMTKWSKESTPTAMNK